MIKAVCATLLAVLIFTASESSAALVGGNSKTKFAAERPILTQANDAERTWEAIKDTTSVAVLNSFIARYKGTRFADLARDRLEKIKVKEVPAPISSLNEKATAEEMLAELPIDADILQLVEAHPFFSGQAPVAVESYALTRSKTEMHGGYATTMTTDEKAAVRPIRGNIIRLEQIQDNSVTQAKVTTKYKRQSLEIHAASGLLELASKTGGVGRPGSEQVSTLIRLHNIQGRVFPLQKGNRFSFEAIYRQVDATAPEQLTQKRSCHVVDDQDAAGIHPKLAGRAYVMTCRFDIAYRRSKRYTGSLGIHSSDYTSVFIAQLGIWLDTTGSYSLKTVQLRQ